MVNLSQKSKYVYSTFTCHLSLGQAVIGMYGKMKSLAFKWLCRQGTFRQVFYRSSDVLEYRQIVYLTS